MRTTKSKKTAVVTPVSKPVTNEHSSSYLKIKAYLEKHNAELDPNTRRYFDAFHLGESTVVMEINDQIIATNNHGAGQWDELYISSRGVCSWGKSICCGF